MSLQVINSRLRLHENFNSIRTTGLEYKQLQDLLKDVDELLASDRHFLLGNWLEKAKQAAQAINDPALIDDVFVTKDRRELYEYNARTQITTWSPGGSLKDYANKQWSGLVRDYYAKRWSFFADALLESLVDPSTHPFNATRYLKEIFDKVERPFGHLTKEYPTEEIGDSFWLAKKLHAKWRPIADRHAGFYRTIGRWAKTGKLRTIGRKWSRKMERRRNRFRDG